MESPERVCPGCGLTLGELHATGLLGCARCYAVFAREVEAAVEALHAVCAPEAEHPWPTRRAVRDPRESTSGPMATSRDPDVH